MTCRGGAGGGGRIFSMICGCCWTGGVGGRSPNFDEQKLFFCLIFRKEKTYG